MKVKTTGFLYNISMGLLGLMLVLASPGKLLIAQARAQTTDIPVTDHLDYLLLDRENGWLLKDNKLYRTMTGGASWEAISPDTEYDLILSAFFLNSAQGWAVTANLSSPVPEYQLTNTTDSGKSWSSQALDLFNAGDPGLYPSAVYMDWLDGKTGWIVFKIGTSTSSSLGTLFFTSDGGTTWNKLTTPIGEPVHFISRSMGWTAGGAGGNELFRTLNGGGTWVSQSFATSSNRMIRHILPSFFSDTAGVLPVIVQSGPSAWVEFYRTYDGGATWTFFCRVGYDDFGLGGMPSIQVLDIDTYLVISPNGKRVLLSDNGTITEKIADQTFTSLTVKMFDAEIGLGSGTTKSCSPVEGSGAPGGKRSFSCTVETHLLSSGNGGIAWQIVDPITPVQRMMAADNAITYTASNAAVTSGTAPIALTFAGQGFDSCNPPSIAQMQDWWNNSPYEAWNIYMGGGNMGCKATNIPTITQAYIAALAQQGWKFIPLWVGKQAPCSTGNWYKISYNLETAYAEGVAEANSAADRATSLGLAGTIVYFDMEAYDTGNTSCRAATKSFITGWTARLHARGFKAGVYGASCAGGLADFNTIADKPDALWIANWIYNAYNPAASVYGTSCLSDSLYNNHQRIRQYSGDHNETWGNTTWDIDCDVFDGIVAVPGGVVISAPPAPVPVTPANSYYFNEGDPIILSWSSTGNEYYGQIYGGPSGTLVFGWLGTPSQTLGLLPPGYTYAWHVKARNSSGESPYSDTWSFSVRPAGPTALVASSTSSSQIQLNWQDNSSYEDGYKLFRNGILIATLGGGTASYLDAGLQEGRSYTYQVKAFRGIYDSVPSNAASVTISLTCFTLSKTATPANYGSISVSPPPNCNNGTQYTKDTTVTLTAIPITSTNFITWSGAASGNQNPVQIAMDTTRVVTANFEIKAYPLVIVSSGNGIVISNPTGINCGSDCTQLYNHGTLVTLTASAGNGYYFTGWGGNCAGTGYCGITMSSAKDVTASFQPCFTVNALVNHTAAGSVKISPTPNCGTAYKPGTLLTLTATSASGFAFNQWMGDLSGSAATGNITVSSNKVIMAEFLPCYSLTTSASPANAGVINVLPTANCGPGFFRQGTRLTITAVPFTGSSFLGWSGAPPAAGNPASIVIDSGTSITGNFVTLPSVPLLIIPAQGTLITSASAVLDWSDASPNLHHYELQIAADTAFVNMITEETELSASTFIASALPANSLLYWRVMAVESHGLARGWSAVRSLRTAPQSPTLVSPASGVHISTLRPTFTWEPAEGALSYIIQISRNENFTLLAHSAAIQALTGYTPNVDLPMNTALYWRIQVRTGSGYSSWSEVRSFITPSPPTVPLLTMPLANTLIADTSVLLDWRDVSLSSGTVFQKYVVQIGTDSGFNSASTIEIAGNINNSQYQVSSLQPNTTWYWRARAYNSNGDASAWSLHWTFRTAILPPILSQPSNNSLVTSLRPTFDWADVTGSSGYTLQISRNETFTLLISSVNINGPTNSTYVPAGNLPADQTLYWRVRTNGVNGPSAFTSPIWTFRVPNPPYEPALLTPAGNMLITDLSPLLTWSRSYIPSGISFDHYQVQISSDAGFTNILRDVVISNYNETTYEVQPELTLASQYFWHARTCNTLGQCSLWSTAFSFRTALPGPDLISPTNTSILNTYRPVFDWADVPGATSYTIQITSDAAFTRNWLYVTVPTSTYTAPTNLPANIPLYWRVRANNNSGSGSWTSPGWSFTLKP